MTRRRGRPPNPNAQRRQTTRAGRAGAQTNEPLKEKRMQQHGMPHVGEHPLDILAGRLLLTPPPKTDDEQDQAIARNSILRDVGRDLQDLHRRVFGRASAPAIDLHTEVKARDASGETEGDKAAKRRLAEMDSILQELGSATRTAVYNVAVYERMLPDWRRAESAERLLLRLRAGLSALADRNQPRAIHRPMRAQVLEAVA